MEADKKDDYDEDNDDDDDDDDDSSNSISAFLINLGCPMQYIYQKRLQRFTSDE